MITAEKVVSVAELLNRLLIKKNVGTTMKIYSSHNVQGFVRLLIVLMVQTARPEEPS